MSYPKTDYSFVSSAIFKDNRQLYAVTGPAGSGKTFATEKLAELHDYTVYSADFRFIGDSKDRRELLERKQAKSAADYKDSANQFNWWDWSAIYRDIRSLMSGGSVIIKAPYDRQTGKNFGEIEIRPKKVIIFEGAILGPPQLVEKFSKIFFMCTQQTVRFERIMQKDLNRRSFSETLARFLITEYSETLYYKNLFLWGKNKLTYLDSSTGYPCPQPELAVELFVPLRVNP